MDRITHWNKKLHQWGLPQGPGSFRTIAERLAEYENIGLEPAAIKTILSAISNMPEVLPVIINTLEETK